MVTRRRRRYTGSMATAEEIRRKLAAYRQHLAEGLDGDRALYYLREIRRLQAKLDALETDSDKRE
jgi:hypothetical protein